jgi:outer membrane protein OmpA-like peptidoglycan-associated protein
MVKPTYIAATVVLLIGAPALAQELTLDSFDLGDDTETEAKEPAVGQESDIETCLLNPSACQNEELRSGSSLSIDDVVNLGVIDREQVATTQTSAGGVAEPVNTAQALPSIDMEILFDYNSANIRADQAVRLAELSAILRDPKFESFTLAFIGHTDAIGSASYNQTLSQQRAQSVALFVSQTAQIPLARISSTGLGFSRLKTPSNPAGAQNRRVQLVLIPR